MTIYSLIPLLVAFFLSALALALHRATRRVGRRGYVTVWPQAVAEDDGEYSND